MKAFNHLTASSPLHCFASRCLAVILCTICLCLADPANAQNESSSQLIEKGVNAEKLGLLDLANNYYLQAQSANAEDAEAYLRMGLLHERRCHFNHAEQNYRMVISLHDTTGMENTSQPSDSTLALAYEHLACCMIENDEFSDLPALTAIVEKAIELNPNSASAYASMALICSKQRNYTNAITWAKRAISINARYPRGYNTLGVIYYHRGNDSDAITQFRKAIAIDPNNIDAYYNLGVMYVLRNNFESAISNLKKGLQRDNKSVRLYYFLGLAYIQRGDTPKAIACYETIIQQIDSLFTPAYNQLGAIYCNKGDYDKAVAYHQKAARIDPQDPESFKCLGKVNTDRADYVKALRNYQKAVQLNDKDHETYCLIAKLYAKQGNQARQTSSYKKAAKLGNKEAQQWMVSRGMAW